MYFRIHETPDHYVTLQNDVTSDFIGVDEQNNLLPTQFVKAYSDEAKFEVNLVVCVFLSYLLWNMGYGNLTCVKLLGPNII